MTQGVYISPNWVQGGCSRRMRSARKTPWRQGSGGCQSCSPRFPDLRADERPSRGEREHGSGRPVSGSPAFRVYPHLPVDSPGDNRPPVLKLTPLPSGSPFFRVRAHLGAPSDSFVTSDTMCDVTNPFPLWWGRQV